MAMGNAPNNQGMVNPGLNPGMRADAPVFFPGTAGAVIIPSNGSGGRNKGSNSASSRGQGMKSMQQHMMAGGGSSENPPPAAKAMPGSKSKYNDAVPDELDVMRGRMMLLQALKDMEIKERA